jgi:hypothetical protein
MSDYDKALMLLYTEVFASKISTGADASDADRVAAIAVRMFKVEFHRPDARKADY